MNVILTSSGLFSLLLQLEEEVKQLRVEAELLKVTIPSDRNRKSPLSKKGGSPNSRPLRARKPPAGRVMDPLPHRALDGDVANVATTEVVEEM